MPDGSECMCGVCLTTAPDAEEGIAASKAPPPTEPEKFDPPREGWWTYEVTVPDGHTGGLGPVPRKPGPATRKQRRAAAR